ncbi:MAG TPA: ribulose-phosphate 3-epimerase [Gemmatimonadaceae bacterium]|jgi:ribulose-phosphate 3-epimerase|nr:ribulose-phosphate 3-epimerase [Gemmatimonadaceae bacterium]
MKVRIAPSILSADFGHLADEIRMCEEGGADVIHLDVMDGRFVPNITFGEKVIASARKATSLPLDVHMMVVEPENYFESFAGAGATGMTIHVEAAPHLQRQLARIRELGCLAGAAVNPGTSFGAIREVALDLDLLLIMTVNPGFGGQEFIPASVDKVSRARRLLDEMRSHAALEVDGGIARDTIEKVWRAGADTFVAGNAVFSASDPKAEIEALRRICLETV